MPYSTFFRNQNLAGIVATAAVLIFTGCNKSQTTPGGGTPGAPPPPVKLPAIVLAPVSATAGVSATGTILAEREVEIKAEIPGKVIHIGFREGEKVAEGQVLVKLDDAELKALWERTQGRLTLAEAQEKRFREQLEAQAVSQREYEQAHADLQTAKAEADLAKAQLAKCELRAPFSGQAGLRGVELGSVIQTGARVTTLQDLGSLRVEFAVPEQQAGAVKTGMSVRFSTSGSPDTETAVIYALESRIDPETRQLNVRARCSKPKARWLPGSFARVELPLRSDASLWVPSQAVVQSARGSMVWLARGGKGELRPFTPGLRTAQAVQAARGLSAGDTVLVSGLMQLRPGAAVLPELSP